MTATTATAGWTRLRAALAPLPIGMWPTPIEAYADTAGMPVVYVKRDDLSARPYGGSKVRNLEWILGDARRKGRTTLLTVATHGSHLVLALAVHGARHGFRVRAALIPQPASPEVEATLARVRATGADVIRCPTTLGVVPALVRHLGAMRRSGERPYWVAPGGASAIGMLGYVQAAREIAEQVEGGLMPPPDWVFCAAGSCGTLVGLAEGFASVGLSPTVVGIRVVPRVATLWPRVPWMRQRLRQLLRERGGIESRTSVRIVMAHGSVGGGYGVESAAARAAAESWKARHLVLDGTYTAKAMAGMTEFIRKRRLEGRTHLFINTFDARPAGFAP